jgi:hypothetical protein
MMVGDIGRWHQGDASSADGHEVRTIYAEGAGLRGIPECSSASARIRIADSQWLLPHGERRLLAK